jgi:hypothetical protein
MEFFYCCWLDDFKIINIMFDIYQEGDEDSYTNIWIV